MPDTAREQGGPTRIMREYRVVVPASSAQIHFAADQQFGQSWLQPGTLLQAQQCGGRQQWIKTRSKTARMDRGNKLAQPVRS
ncbi:hypothetical protein CQ12_39370 [Bradyrhizobium jicamae]|uniref:Uncharacterized protein n=1 Tax=Bradyrhizobium jicamae TaxID=280332 RepID=A0A0R3KMX9_9BRAD|nr:hypothetical protein CQ12_39370 [Bradyrhizobium jicamae]